MIGDPFAPSCKTLAGKKQTLVTALVLSQGLDQLHQVSVGGVHSPHYASVCRERACVQESERTKKFLKSGIDRRYFVFNVVLIDFL